MRFWAWMLALLVFAGCVSPGCPEGYRRAGDRCVPLEPEAGIDVPDGAPCMPSEQEEACDGLDADCDGLDDTRDPDARAWCNDASRALPFAIARCGASGCETERCTDERLDCTSAPGCETDPGTAIAHCGACGQRCAWSCREGACDDAVQLAGGFRYACARRRSGAVVCWGLNELGSLGDGTNVDRAAPVAVTGIDDAVEISAGQRHVCARRTSGAVLCWGANDLQQLAGGTTASFSPRAVEVLSSADDVVELAAGGFHTCVRTSGGRVLCWGANPDGQVANGRPSRSVGAPFDVGIDDAVELAAGGFHTCARRASGAVVCWGANSVGQLGDGTTTTRSVVAADITGLHARALAAGAMHTCAIRSEGGVVCWGWNLWGQLGLGHDADQLRPGRAVDLDGVVEIATGNDHSCARTAAGVFCWGKNDYGQLGLGVSVRVLLSPPPIPVLDDAVEIAGTTLDTCVRRASGQVVCWGDNERGQIGDGSVGMPRRAPGAPVRAPR